MREGRVNALDDSLRDAIRARWRKLTEPGGVPACKTRDRAATNAPSRVFSLDAAQRVWQVAAVWAPSSGAGRPKDGAVPQQDPPRVRRCAREGRPRVAVGLAVQCIFPVHVRSPRRSPVTFVWVRQCEIVVSVHPARMMIGVLQDAVAGHASCCSEPAVPVSLCRDEPVPEGLEQSVSASTAALCILAIARAVGHTPGIGVWPWRQRS